MKPLPLAVPHAAVLAFAHEGHDVVVAHPEGFDLDEGVLADARPVRRRRPAAALTVTHDRAAAFDGRRGRLRQVLGGARATTATRRPRRGAPRAPPRTGSSTRPRMARTDGAIFMHCLPVRRGVVVTDEVLDSPASVVVEQAGARLDVQKATLCRALGVEVAS